MEAATLLYHAVNANIIAALSTQPYQQRFHWFHFLYHATSTQTRCNNCPQLTATIFTSRSTIHEIQYSSLMICTSIQHNTKEHQRVQCWKIRVSVQLLHKKCNSATKGARKKLGFTSVADWVAIYKNRGRWSGSLPLLPMRREMNSSMEESLPNDKQNRSTKIQREGMWFITQQSLPQETILSNAHLQNWLIIIWNFST